MSVSVVVITFERPDFVARCLDHLRAQTYPPIEIVVIDSSLSVDTEQLIRARFPGVTYRRSSAGAGAMATARDIGFRMTRGEILAFIDDDAFAEPDWLENLVPHYRDPEVGGVGGRQVRGQLGEISAGVEAIGRLRPDGTLTGNFAADPGRPVEVDHMLGANMSFRRSVIEQIGGIRDGYGGTCVREETDLCLRVAHAGFRLMYTPDAVVEHVAAPYAKGQRFDLRYAYWDQKNHVIVLIRNFGLFDPIVRRYLLTSFRRLAKDSSDRSRRSWSRARGRDARGAFAAAGGAVFRPAVVVAATATGLAAGFLLAREDT